MKSDNKRLQYKTVICIAVAVFILFSFLAERSGAWDVLLNKISSNETVNVDYVRFLSVGQAECTLFHTDGKYGAIDIGNSADDGIKILKSLRQNNIHKLDFLIISHAHTDHIGGLLAVADEVEIPKIFCMAGAFDDAGISNQLHRITDKHGIEIINIKEGDAVAFGKFKFNVVWADTNKSGNDRSLVIMAKHKNRSIFFGGDISSSVEKQILKSGFDQKCDVMKASHHGSNNSNSSDFMKSLSPKCIVVMCGKNNEYDFPGKKFLSRANELGINVLSTSEGGDILYYPDKNKIVKK